jgi:hypothetical protein
MAVPALLAVPAISRVGNFFKTLFTSKWLYIALAFAAVAGGTYLYLKNDKADAVNQATVTATEKANSSATIQSLEAQTRVSDRAAGVDRDYIAKREQTAKDYANARNTIETAPVEERDAPAPRLLIDTLNELDRMHQRREHPDSVHQPETPAG